MALMVVGIAPEMAFDRKFRCLCTVKVYNTNQGEELMLDQRYANPASLPTAASIGVDVAMQVMATTVRTSGESA